MICKKHFKSREESVALSELGVFREVKTNEGCASFWDTYALSVSGFWVPSFRPGPHVGKSFCSTLETRRLFFRRRRGPERPERNLRVLQYLPGALKRCKILFDDSVIVLTFVRRRQEKQISRAVNTRATSLSLTTPDQINQWIFLRFTSKPI